MKLKCFAVVLLLVAAGHAQVSSTGSISASGTTCSTTQACISLTLYNSVNGSTGGVAVSIPANASGNTLQFEGTADGTNWVAVNATPFNSTTAVTSTTSTGTWQINAAGLVGIRVRCSTFVSGTATVTIQASTASARSGGGAGTTVFAGAPTGSCSSNQTAVNSSTGDYYSCNSTVWLLVGPGAAGSAAWSTVTSGTNAGQTLTVGAGSTLTTASTGIVNANKINGVAPSTLATGIVKNTTTTGVPSIAIAADFPTLNQSTSGNAATATAAASAGTECSAGMAARGVDASWNARDCFSPAGSGNTTSTTLTTNSLPKANGANSIVDSLFTDDGTTGSYTGSGGLAISGTVGVLTGTEGTAPSGSASKDILYSDSTAHRWKMKNNNGSAVQVVASGADINTSDQVTVTHLAAALPVNQGGTGTTSTLTGLMRGNASAMTAAELSGVITTSGSNVTSYAIASTTFTVSNATFGANTCTKLDGTAGSSTVSMTGVATTSEFLITPAADSASIVGFGTAGGLVIDAWPTSNTANIKVCNQTASGITTGASLTFNIGAR